MPSRTTIQSYNSAEVSALRDSTSAVNTILSGRKCWRILKGKNEPVWPPALEAALIEGLKKYKPTGTRSTKALGRLPMRNKFVSDYIFETTGKRRTPKQVGSRIQQLRDTNSGKHIVKELSDHHYDMLRPARSSSEEEDTNGLSPNAEPMEPHHIEIPVPPLHDETHLSGYPSSPSSSSSPRPLREIDPTTTFLSATKFDCVSVSDVYHNDLHVSQESTQPECHPIPYFPSSEYGNARFRYSTSLAPDYWPRLCSSSDPTQYTIHQRIFRVEGGLVSSVMYHFVFASPSSRSISPASVDDSSSLGDYSPSSGSAINLSADFEHYTTPTMEVLSIQPSLMRSTFEADPSLYMTQPMYHPEAAFGSEPASPLNATMSGMIPFSNDLMSAQVIPTLSTAGQVGEHLFPAEHGTYASNLTYSHMF